MSAPLQDLVTLDRLVHEPARFAILTVLSARRRADFQSLQAMTGLGPGNLSAHLRRLRERGLITIDKRSNGTRLQTWLEITPAGRSAFQEHWKRLETNRSPSVTDSLRNIRRLADGADLLIDSALERNVGNRGRAAEELGISLATLKRKLRRRRRPTPAGEPGA
jgi:DNA-binding MarR family transcriptional regulator